MQIIIRYALPPKDGQQEIVTKTLENVVKEGMNPAGLLIYFNGDGQPIFSVPAGAIVDINYPGHDTKLTIPQIQLAQM